MDIKDIIQEGRAIRNLSVKADIQSAYHAWCRNVRSFLKENSINEQLQNEAAVKMHYTDNEYSESDTLHSLKRALTDTLDFLEENAGYLDSCNLIIETKCTRDSMSERQLTEELGADSFHYPADNICFFIWDRNKIIKNPEAFKKAFEENPSEKSKTIKVFITQPMEL